MFCFDLNTNSTSRVEDTSDFNPVWIQCFDKIVQHLVKLHARGMRLLLDMTIDRA